MNIYTRSILTARQWLNDNPLFLDTETTGLGSEAEICEIAIVDGDGAIVLHSLVKPSRAISPDATRVHGIAQADVESAPTFAALAQEITRLITAAPTITYNAAYDTRMLRQSARAAGLDWSRATLDARFRCAMLLYARFLVSYRWQKLSTAAVQCGIISNNLHRAVADARTTRLLVQYMAEQQENEE